MREHFFHLNKKFGKMIKNTCHYMLNVVPHIFSSIYSKNPRALDVYVQHNKILNSLIIFIITVAAGRILMFHLQRKKYARKFRVERTSSDKVVHKAFRQCFNIFWYF